MNWNYNDRVEFENLTVVGITSICVLWVCFIEPIIKMMGGGN